MRKITVIITTLLLLTLTTWAQNDPYLFISIKNPLYRNIKSIKWFTSDCFKKDTSSCFVEYRFQNGLLKKELSFDDAKSSLQDADELAYIYNYKKDVKSRKYLLDVRTGDAYNGPSQQEHFENYRYINGRMDTKIYTEGTFRNLQGYLLKKPDIFQNKTKYFYNAKGKVDHEEIIDEEKKLTVKYYLYNADQLIGYLPSPDRNENPMAPPLFFMQDKYISQLKKIGFDSFRRQNIPDDLYNKLVDNSYEPTRSDQLFIDSIPIKTYIRNKTGKDFRYIVIEIADCYFLFYKLTD